MIDNLKILPDVILLDVLMSGLDGYTVCGRLKENEKTKDIPVIFAMQLGNLEDEIDGFRHGGIDYIDKPYNSLIVQARVKNYIKLKRRTDELKSMIEKNRDKLNALEEMNDPFMDEENINDSRIHAFCSSMKFI